MQKNNHPLKHPLVLQLVVRFHSSMFGLFRRVVTLRQLRRVTADLPGTSNAAVHTNLPALT